MLRSAMIVAVQVIHRVLTSGRWRPARVRSAFGLFNALVMCAVIIPPVGAQEAGEPAIEAVQAEIRALQQRLERQNRELDAGQRDLRDQERAIADRTRELAAIRDRRDTQSERAGRLRAQAVEVLGRLTDERQVLAEQVRMTYLSGRREMLKLLLNQENPARLGRLLVYYDHLNRERSRRIGAVSRNLEEQERLAVESERVATELVSLEQAQADELAGLVSAQEERRQVLARIEEGIRGADSELQRLLEEERRLTRVVDEVDALVTEYPADVALAFSDARGRLTWPVGGDLINDYGDSRVDGQLRWNGVMVGAPRGSLVRSVHSGRVVYADWLPGLGLLVIVDHGMGYMSLYGHNEAILTESGAGVGAGQPIAQVGDSGGQRQSALYFEIREDGDPIDPRPWMNARLSR